MNIRVVQVDQAVKSVVVEFISEHGRGKALWRGEPPEAGLTYEVEVDLPGSLDWGREIMKAMRKHFSLHMENDMCHLTGICESVSEDGFTFLRLGHTIIMLETTGEPCCVGDFIEVVAPTLVLHDVRT